MTRPRTHAQGARRGRRACPFRVGQRLCHRIGAGRQVEAVVAAGVGKLRDGRYRPLGVAAGEGDLPASYYLAIVIRSVGIGVIEHLAADRCLLDGHSETAIGRVATCIHRRTFDRSGAYCEEAPARR